MMTIEFSQTFRKQFQKRITHPNIKHKFKTRLEWFISNPKHPLLRDHELTGNLSGFRAFSITGDIRVIYHLESPQHAVFVYVGSHNQVY